MRVVIYCINYAPEMAGVGRYNGEIGEYFASLGHDVWVITTPPHYPGWRVQPPYAVIGWTCETLAGVQVFRCPLWLHSEMKGFRRLLAPLSFALSSAPVAFWQILKRRPDVVIAVEPTLLVAPVALLAAKLVGARTVLHVQDLEVDAAFAVGHLAKIGLLRRVAAVFERWAMAPFDRAITISNRMSDRIADKGVARDRIKVIRNWVDLDAIGPRADSTDYRKELGISKAAFVVLYSGNIGAKQGVHLLIEAARELAARPQIVFVVAGAGPMRGEVERAAANLTNLRVLDFQPLDRFAEFLAIADVHVLPQERDTADLVLPSKLGGMLASGRRIVVAADPGTELAEFLGPSCTLTAPGDAGGLARAIATLASEPPCRRQEAERLARAELLAKRVNIQKFADTALFLQKAPPGPLN